MCFVFFFSFFLSLLLRPLYFFLFYWISLNLFSFFLSLSFLLLLLLLLKWFFTVFNWLIIPSNLKFPCCSRVYVWRCVLCVHMCMRMNVCLYRFCICGFSHCLHFIKEILSINANLNQMKKNWLSFIFCCCCCCCCKMSQSETIEKEKQTLWITLAHFDWSSRKYFGLCKNACTKFNMQT